MIIHIVMFKFNKTNKEAHINKATQMLSDLAYSVPTLNSIEIGKDFSNQERSMDLVITTTFDTQEALNAYAIHPAHLKVVEFIKAATEYSRVVDYER
ncbi:MAG: stress responsive protein [Sulfurovum sp. PC08-66]|nr:MAG: stress responsive protein [Sulfurovum sp. PC08-66]